MQTQTFIEGMRRMGKWISEHEQRGQSLDEAHRQALRVVTGASDQPSATEDEMTLDLAKVLTADRWARCGFPTVVMGHRLAASLAATSVPAEHADSVKPPWPTFAIRIPYGIVPWADQNVSTGHVATIWWDEIPLLSSEFGATVALKNVFSLGDVLRAQDPVDDDDDTGRLVTVCARLLVGTCIELDQPNHRSAIAAGAPHRRSPGRLSEDPKSWTFQLTRDVRVDCREWVTSYLRGEEGTRPSVQTLVRGHHKRQAHGPGLTERKWIHVEPYWRGPEDAPIAVRSHVLNG